MSKIAYIVTGSGVTAVIDGQTMSITSDNPSYREVLDAIKTQESPERIAELFRTAEALQQYMNRPQSAAIGGTNGQVEVRDGEVYYQGEALHNVVVERILNFMVEGLPVEPLRLFLQKLLQNPSRRAIQELYQFLEHGSMPITEDGNILAYKGVRDDYMDVYSGKFENRIGSEHSMPRSKVDDDFRVGCSHGFHVGSVQYATSYGTKTVIVEVDPADVVSVPEDSSHQKMRCCHYRVVAEFQGPMNRALASAGAPYDEADEEDDGDEDGDEGSW